MDINPDENKLIRDLETPFYKILFVLSTFTLIVFFIFFVILYHRNNFLKESYSILEIEGQKNFSNITDYHSIGEVNKRKHIYTYLLTDGKGELHEINEYVDEKTHLRLRVGNTIQTKYLRTVYLGWEMFISRIDGNKQTFPNLNFLLNFSKFGILFGFLLLFSSFFNFLFLRK